MTEDVWDEKLYILNWLWGKQVQTHSDLLTEAGCYATTMHTAQLELIVRILQLAPSDVLDRQLNDAQLVGS